MMTAAKLVLVIKIETRKMCANIYYSIVTTDQAGTLSPGCHRIIQMSKQFNNICLPNKLKVSKEC